MSIAGSLGLAVDEAVVLNDSNKLTVRLLPCDVVARVAPVGQHVAAFELELARQLLAAGCPVAEPVPRGEPRPYEQDGFVVTFWRHYESAPPAELPAADYARALARLHAGMRTLDVATPHVMDRVAQAQQLVANPDPTSGFDEADRELLAQTLRVTSRRVGERQAPEQLLHGEPHPGNVLATSDGPVFIDLETCCRGPVEFDLAHAPDRVAEHYPGVDSELLGDCRMLVLAVNTAWRWEPGDQLPRGRELAAEWLGQLRTLASRI